MRWQSADASYDSRTFWTTFPIRGAMKRSRIAVAGLRSADPATLEILTADVLRRPITQLDPGTLADLLALSEVPDQTGGQLARDLTKFRDQMFRELDDLPDGVAVAEFCADLRSVSADLIPRNLRQRLVGLREAVRTAGGALSGFVFTGRRKHIPEAIYRWL